MEKLEKEPSVPQWVLDKFAEPMEKIPSPVANQPMPPVTDLIISFAKKEIILASNNLKFLVNPQQRVEERKRLAENLLVLGEFSEALKYADSPELRDRIRVYRNAVEIDDNKVCECSDGESQLEQTKIPLSRFRVVQKIYSPKHGKVIDIRQCVNCKFTNGTDVITKTEIDIKKAVAKSSVENSDLRR